MSMTREFRGALAGLALWAGVVLVAKAPAQNCDCQTGHCPPCVKYRFEGAPRLMFKHGCPKPICDPCHLPHYGYYPVCWQPWPWPPDWSHCPVPPPGALVPPIPPKRFRGEPPLDEETGPKPKKVFAPDGSAQGPQWLPPASMPPLSQASAPRQLPQGPVNQAVSRQPEVIAPAPLPQVVAPTPVEVPTPEPVSEPAVLTPTNFKPMEPAESMAKPAEAQRPQEIKAGPSGSSMRMVNSRRILLDYDLADVPTPDQSMLELWFTQDGKTWVKDETIVKSGSPYVVEVNREGTYGFTMIARAPGEKSDPPTPDEAPQVWVEVDWSKPTVQLIDLRVGTGPTGRTMALVWMATDNNLARAPITLSYAETPDGPWKTFAANVENTGRYVWQVPNNVPQRLFVKVEAFDLVGNAGQAQTPSAVVLP